MMRHETPLLATLPDGEKNGLVAEDASFMTGGSYLVDGGYTAV